MARICFVTYEIYPTTWGGCGTLLHNAAWVLLSQGHEVVFVLDMPHDYFERFLHEDRLALPNSRRCRAYHVDTLCATIPFTRGDFLSEAQWRSYRFHYACVQVVDAERPDVVEFFDYCGVAHYALAAKVAGAAYATTHLAVRLHNSLEVMDAYEATKPLDAERYSYYALEHSSFQLAETVLYPSPSYYERAYQPRYEPWWGQQIFSKPPLISVPRYAGPRPDANTVLYYGRLFAFKGVDRFVNAAVMLLEAGSAPDVQFVLAGYDSRAAPDGSATYQEYLRKKIPAAYQGRFVFADQIGRQQLEDLLPSVLCAVFPSYIEAFCYAAHELYAAGLPIVVSDIPNFQDYFRHEQNALVFDGSTSDLACQIGRLCDSSELRARLAQPYSVADDPLGTFYGSPMPPSWICADDAAPLPELLVCIIADDERETEMTLGALAQARTEHTRVVLMRPYDGAGAAIWLLGTLYTLHSAQGEPIAPTELRTAEALLLLCAGDRLAPSYLRRCLQTLARQPQIAFVGSWKQIDDRGHRRLDTFPLDAAPELALFAGVSPLSRTVMRTAPGQLLLDLFNTQADRFGELAYLWQIADDTRRGVIIPEPLVVQLAEPAAVPSPQVVAYLALQDWSPWRKARLAQYLATTQSAPAPTPDSALLGKVAALEAQLDDVRGSTVGRLDVAYRRLRAGTATRLGRDPLVGRRALGLLRRVRGAVKPLLHRAITK